MNCLRASDDGGAGTASHVAAGRVRSWSSSHVDSVGAASNAQSRNSGDGQQETWRRQRLQQILFKSVLQNDLDMVVRCLHHGADLAERYPQHAQTVLHVAARRGFLRMTELLLRAGADPNAIDERSFLPLHNACQEGHYNTVKCLLAYGSMVTVENEYGDAPIHTCTRYGHANLLPLLLAVDLRRDYAGQKSEGNHLEQMDHLNLQNANGDTCLHIACALDRKHIVKKLLQWGADLTLVNRQNATPLQIAVDKQNPQLVKQLCNPPPLLPFNLDTASTSGAGTHVPETGARFEDEAARHDVLSRSYLEPSIARTISADNVSHQAMQKPFYGPTSVYPAFSMSPIIDVPDAPMMSNSQYHDNKIVAVSRRQPSLQQTKLVELDPQPNNVGGGGRGVSGHIASAKPVVTRRGQESENGTERPLHVKRVTTKENSVVEKRLDELSQEMNSKLQDLNAKYTQLEKREEELRRSVKRRDTDSDQKRSRASPIRVVIEEKRTQVTDVKERKVNGTSSFVPQAPTLPDTRAEQTWLRGEHIVVINNDVLGSEDACSDGDTPEKSPEYSLVTGVRNGKRYIKEAPKLTDVSVWRKGRVSPKIRDLQDQLRRAHRRTYSLEDEESV